MNIETRTELAEAVVGAYFETTLGTTLQDVVARESVRLIVRELTADASEPAPADTEDMEPLYRAGS